MMTIVVESRKRFGKMCVKYEQNTSKLENKILNFHIETLSNYKFKPKYNIPVFDKDDIDDLDKFCLEMSQRGRRIDELKRRIKNTQEVVVQLKADSLGKRLREPLTVENLLAKAEGKKV